jgi:hypothetical protein
VIGIGSIYKPASVETQPQQRSGTMAEKITHTIVYASSDGKACLANAQISTTLYHPDYPLGLKPGSYIMLLASDESICDVLNQSSIAKIEIQFRVALAPLTLKAIPPTLRADLPSSQSLYRVIQVNIGTRTMIIIRI